ncbi:MAG: hypothetical protein NZ658_08790 [Pirellulales bacterium]|nr:hypothetical protein [Pirellulales bacterium]
MPDWLDRLAVAVDTAIETAETASASQRDLATAFTASLEEAVPWSRVAWDPLRQALEGEGEP